MSLSSRQLFYTLWLLNIIKVLAVDCDFGPPKTNITCPVGNTTDAYCESSSLEGSIIFRCIDGCPQPGNCNDDLAGVPPYGVKTLAECWQESATEGNAQCTVDCVNVTLADGSLSYPLGCSFQVVNTTGPPTTTTLSELLHTSTSSTPAGPSTTSSKKSLAQREAAGLMTLSVCFALLAMRDFMCFF